MKHLARILAVAVPILVAAYSTALRTPSVTNLLERHPFAAGYVAAAAGILHAAWKAYTDSRQGTDVPGPPSSGSSMGAK